MFIKTGFYDSKGAPAANSIRGYMATAGINMPGAIKANILVERAQECEAMKHPPAAIRISFIGEELEVLTIDPSRKRASFERSLVDGRRYCFESLDDNGHAISAMHMKAEPLMRLRLGRHIS